MEKSHKVFGNESIPPRVASLNYCRMIEIALPHTQNTQKPRATFGMLWSLTVLHRQSISGIYEDIQHEHGNEHETYTCIMFYYFNLLDVSGSGLLLFFFLFRRLSFHHSFCINCGCFCNFCLPLCYTRLMKNA